MAKRKSVSFSSVTMLQLRQVVTLRPKATDSLFLIEWTDFQYIILDEDLLFLNKLIQKNKNLINYYLEEEVKAKFIIPLLNKIDFCVGETQDWYERTLKTKINSVEIGGKTDYLVAKGFAEPEVPYFFIQKFKPTLTSSSPEEQLLAELIVALQLNQRNEIKGCYIIGRYWHFMVLEKNENIYEYSVSKGFDSMDLNDLKKIYNLLQAVKQKYCN
jgi:hypothetical protein